MKAEVTTVTLPTITGEAHYVKIKTEHGEDHISVGLKTKQKVEALGKPKPAKPTTNEKAH